jgi:hypothetical protein
MRWTKAGDTEGDAGAEGSYDVLVECLEMLEGEGKRGERMGKGQTFLVKKMGRLEYLSSLRYLGHDNHILAVHTLRATTYGAEQIGI